MQTKKRDYISKTGFETLEAEWKDLKYTQRPAMKKQVAEAAAEGDRSENAAYTFGKMKLRDIDRRLRFLDHLIDRAVVVEKNQGDGSIRFGRTATLRNNTGREFTYTIVGSAEVDPLKRQISMESPLGAAMVGKRAGDRFCFESPRGQVDYEVIHVD